MDTSSGGRPGGDASRAARATPHRLWTGAESYIRRKLLWNRVYRVSSYLRSALWIVPIVAMLLVFAAAPSLRVLDAWLGWRLVGLDLAGTQALYQTVITLTLSFMVFTFGSLLVAIQIAGGQLTPRIIATTLLRDNVVRYSVGLFVFTLIFAVMSLNRLERNPPELVALVTAILGIACMAMFLFLIDYAARLLRPVSIVARVGNDAVAVVEAVYPEKGDSGFDDAITPTALPEGPHRIVLHDDTSEVMLAVDRRMLMAEAENANGVVELVPQVGDFVTRGEPLFALHGGAVAIDDRKLRATVAFGSERTMEQDPIFGLRILVDIALKALSAAINDPTTAVVAIDQVHRVLRAVGKRRVHGEAITDRQGRLRILQRTPNWEDFVNVAFTEIRSSGAGQIQIARRLRAMLDNLFEALPSHRHAALAQQRELLDRVIEAHHRFPEDLALARLPDTQGLGGATVRVRRETP